MKENQINANRNRLLEKDVGLEEAYLHTTFWYLRTNKVENERMPLENNLKHKITERENHNDDCNSLCEFNNKFWQFISMCWVQKLKPCSLVSKVTKIEQILLLT